WTNRSGTGWAGNPVESRRRDHPRCPLCSTTPSRPSFRANFAASVVASPSPSPCAATCALSKPRSTARTVSATSRSVAGTGSN
ncbi:MAG: hypothetical protein AVDCRST_MAG88-4243, partial [uncultured Thermomicrobiales bacterium]